MKHTILLFTNKQREYGGNIVHNDMFNEGKGRI